MTRIGRARRTEPDGSRRLRRTAAVAVAVALGCAGSRRDAPSARPPEPRIDPPPVAAPSSSAPPPVAAQEAPPPEAPPAAAEAPARLPDPPGSTRGTIACGKERGVADKQSCRLEGDRWRCVEGKPPPSTSTLYCDDGTDCGPGLTCCQTGASADSVYTCSRRHGPETECAMEVCKPDGARCPQGSRCEGDYCVSEHRATCPTAGKKKCATDEHCEWKGGTASCVKEPLPVEDVADARGVFECTRASDCGAGSQCCTSMSVHWRMTYCATNCDATNTTFACETAADCKRKLDLVPPEMRHAAKPLCKPLEGEGPSWLKLCDLQLP